MKRKEILEAAAACVCGQREQDYGKPESSLQNIADLWTAYKRVPFSPVDVAMMMALLKIARINGNHATEDSFVDLAGYAAIGGEVAAGAPQPVPESASPVETVLYGPIPAELLKGTQIEDMLNTEPEPEKPKKRRGGRKKKTETEIEKPKTEEPKTEEPKTEEPKTEKAENGEMKQKRVGGSRKRIDEKAILDMHKAGHSANVIAKALNISYQTVYKKLKELESRDPIPVVEKGVDLAKLAALHNAGWTVEQIAGDMGMSYDDTYTLLRDMIDGGVVPETVPEEDPEESPEE